MSERITAQFRDFYCGEERGDSPFSYRCDRTSRLRNWNMHDADQIIYSTEFRQLSDKIQLLPYEHSRRRTRLIHTLEVVRIAKEISKNLGLNIELAEAIALGHDLGNSALGKAGNKVIMDKYKVHHQELSYLAALLLSARTVADDSDVKEHILRQGKDKPCKLKDSTSDIEYYGVNYCDTAIDFPIQPEVLDGIRKHTDDKRTPLPLTLEGQVVRYADNFAYMVQDIDDAFRASILGYEEYESKRESEKLRDKNWSDMRDVQLHGEADLKNIFDKSVGERVATLISRFVDYNNLKFAKHRGSFKWIKSPFLSKDIPVLEVDEHLQFIICYIWDDLLEKIVYKHPRIQFAREQYENIMHCLISILDDKYEIFVDGNRHLDEAVRKKYSESIDMMAKLNFNPLFCERSENIKKAFILSRLSYADCTELLGKYKKNELKEIHL